MKNRKLVMFLALMVIPAAGIVASSLQDDDDGNPMLTPVDREDSSVSAEPAWEPIAPGGRTVYDVDPLPGRVLRVLLSNGSRGRLCVFGVASEERPALSHVRCVDTRAPARTTLVPSADTVLGGLSFHAGARSVLTPAARELPAVDDATSIFLESDDRWVTLGPGDDDQLFRRISGSPSPVVGVPAGASLVEGHVLYTESTGGDDDILFVVPPGATEPVVVGPVPSNIERIRGCRSSSALAIVLDGEIVHGERRVGVVFADSDGYTTPVIGDAQITEYQLGCRGSTMTATWMSATEDDDLSLRLVRRLACDPNGCEAGRARVTFAGADPIAIDLAGQTLLLWASEGHTRFRLAPLAELDSAPDVTDMAEPDGPILSRHLYTRAGAAVVLLRTPAGTFAVRIDAAGTSEALSPHEVGDL